MTTETPADPTIEAWSDRLEEDLLESGMEQPQAKAYRLAFELGLTRVISQTATRKELRDGLAELRQEINQLRQELRQEINELRQELRNFATKQDLAQLRGEMRFLFLLFGGIMTGLLSALIAIVA